MPDEALREQVRMHGEMLAKLTTIVDQDHEDLHELKVSTAVIAKAVEAREAREQVKTDIRLKIREVAVPLTCSIIGILAGHFLPH